MEVIYGTLPRDLALQMMCCAVLAAVLFFGEDFGPVNAAGLFILITGVSLYNMYKYKKVKKFKFGHF